MRFNVFLKLSIIMKVSACMFALGYELFVNLIMPYFMKNTLLFFLAVILTACSADDEVLSTTGTNGVTDTTLETVDEEKPAYTICFYETDANVIIDVSNGFGNPRVVFSALINGQWGSLKKGFTAKLEVRTLGDCEDFYSDYQETVTIPFQGVYQNPEVNVPTLSLHPNQLPVECYKWRIVLESGVVNSTFQPYCQSASPWYEAPLF